MLKTNRPISISLEFYDEDHKKKLLNYPEGKWIEELVKKGNIEIPVEEFLTYYLFKRKRPGKPGYSNIDDLRFHVQKAIVDLEGWISYENGNLFSLESRKTQDSTITERVGESVGLSVINRIHKLNLADWDKIPENKGKRARKVLDYQHQCASDGKSIIQVEAKGSTVESNKKTFISGMKIDIEAKKRQSREDEIVDKTYKYGTITTISTSAELGTKCYLLDPPSDEVKFDSRKVQLLNRLNFIRDIVVFLSPRSSLATALANRIVALRALEDLFQLNQQYIVRHDGKPFEGKPDFFKGPNFFPSKSEVKDGQTSGDVTRYDENNLLFIGCRSELIELACGQDFDKIAQFEFQPATIEKKVLCRVPKKKFEHLGLSNQKIYRQISRRQYIEFELSGKLIYSKEGLVFGLLKI